MACVREKKSTDMGLVGKPNGKRHLGRPRHTWQENIHVGRTEI